MKNFDNINLEKQPVSAPEGMYEQVRERIIQERIKIAQTHRQLVFGSALLLIVGALNLGLILFKTSEKQPVSAKNTEKILFETYFDNTVILSNEK